MQFFVGVFHRREPQPAMLLVQPYHDFTHDRDQRLRHSATKNSSKRSDSQPRFQPARLASSVAVQERSEITSLCSPLLLLKAAGLDCTRASLSLASGAGISKRLFAHP